MIWEDNEEFHIILSIMDDGTSCGSLGVHSSIKIRTEIVNVFCKCRLQEEKEMICYMRLVPGI